MPRVDRITKGQTEAERGDADCVFIVIHAEQVPLEQSAQIVHSRLFARMSILPALHEPLKCFHKENSGAAARIEDLHIPFIAAPRQDSVQHKIHKVWRRVVGTQLVLVFVEELFVDAADELKW